MPQRNPVVLAKQIASLDVLSGGRFTLGIGVGYLEPEFRAIGADFEHRGAVTDEFVAAMHTLWYARAARAPRRATSTSAASTPTPARCSSRSRSSSAATPPAAYRRAVARATAGTGSR